MKKVWIIIKIGKNIYAHHNSKKHHKRFDINILFQVVLYFQHKFVSSYLFTSGKVIS